MVTKQKCPCGNSTAMTENDMGSIFCKKCNYAKLSNKEFELEYGTFPSTSTERLKKRRLKN